MSLTNLIQTIKSDLRSISFIINHFKNDHQKLGGLNFAIVSSNALQPHLRDDNLSTIKDTLKEIFDDFLWHAPRKRRSLETRLRRRFGWVDKHQPASKLIKKKNNLVICDECGNSHELENICQICYLKVKAETKIIQDAIMKRLGLNPVEKDVRINYQGEQKTLLDDKYFVEVPKKRPAWFAANLTSNSISHSNERKEISLNNDLEGKLEK